MPEEWVDYSGEGMPEDDEDDEPAGAEEDDD